MEPTKDPRSSPSPPRAGAYVGVPVMRTPPRRGRGVNPDDLRDRPLPRGAMAEPCAPHEHHDGATHRAGGPANGVLGTPYVGETGEGMAHHGPAPQEVLPERYSGVRGRTVSPPDGVIETLSGLGQTEILPKRYSGVRSGISDKRSESHEIPDSEGAPGRKSPTLDRAASLLSSWPRSPPLVRRRAPLSSPPSPVQEKVVLG